METTKDILEQINFLNNQTDKYFKRLEELSLIKIGCDTLNISKAYYNLEEIIIHSNIETLKKQIKILKEKKIV